MADRYRQPGCGWGIDTDLGDAAPAKIRVAHVVSGGSLRGLDVRNVGSAMAGRRIDAEIEDNDFSSAGEIAGPIRQAIRFMNFLGVTGGEIHAKMSGNRFHGSRMGCILESNKTNSGVINVRSNGDIYEDNGSNGCWIGGAFVGNPVTGTFSGASTTFEAHGCNFQNNNEHGLLATGADVLEQTDVAVANEVLIRLFGCKASGNTLGDFRAFGARSTGGIAGTNNTVTIERRGVSTQIDIEATESLPHEPAGTNKVILVS